VNPRRLYRSRDRRLAGVAGGMAEYLDIDPTIMRIAWILAGLLSVGFAILAYILLAIVIPDAPWATASAGPATWGPTAPQAPAPGWAQPAPDWAQPMPGWASPAQGMAASTAQPWASYPPAPAAGTASGWASQGAPPSGWGSAQPAEVRAQARGIGAAGVVGLALIAIGGIALLNAAIPGWIAPAATGPIIVILIGGALLVSSIRRTPPEVSPPMPASQAAPAPSPTPAPGSAAFSTGSPGVSDDATAIDVPLAEPAPEADASASS
jgi:phage shock protein PspC (stress-responsive transcriptional regulator)